MMVDMWPVWIERSVAVYLGSFLKTSNPTYAVELQSNVPPAAPKSTRFELRIDGPYGAPQVNNEWSLKLEINVLLTTKVSDGHNSGFHKSLSGLVARALSGSIELKKYGETVETSLGVLRLGRVVSSYLGRVELSMPIEQSAIEVPATIELTGE